MNPTVNSPRIIFTAAPVYVFTREELINSNFIRVVPYLNKVPEALSPVHERIPGVRL